MRLAKNTNLGVGVLFLGNSCSAGLTYIPSAIENAVFDKIKERFPEKATNWNSGYFIESLAMLTEQFKNQVHSQLSANLLQKRDKRDIATVLVECIQLIRCFLEGFTIPTEGDTRQIFLSTLNNFV